MTCRHRHYTPTIYGFTGFLWCKDCGAIRQITSCATHFWPAEPYWVRPGPMWAKDMERNRRAKEKKP